MGEAANDLRTLRYIAEITRRLAKMLLHTRYQMPVYFLEMTAVEADNLAAAQDPEGKAGQALRSQRSRN